MHYLYLADDHADWLTLRSASSDRSLPAVDYDRRDLVRGANAAGVVRELAVYHSAGRTEDRVHVGVLSPVTVVPLAEFEESTAEAVYQFVFNGRRASKAKRRVFYDMLPSSNGVLLFALDEGHCAEVERELGEVHYFSPFSGLLQWMAGRKQTARQHRVFIHCRTTQIDVAYFEGHRIFAFNTFDVGATVWCGFHLDTVHRLRSRRQNSRGGRLPAPLCGRSGVRRHGGGIRSSSVDRNSSTSF